MSPATRLLIHLTQPALAHLYYLVVDDCPLDLLCVGKQVLTYLPTQWIEAS